MITLSNGTRIDEIEREGYTEAIDATNPTRLLTDDEWNEYASCVAQRAATAHNAALEARREANRQAFADDKAHFSRMADGDATLERVRKYLADTYCEGCENIHESCECWGGAAGDKPDADEQRLRRIDRTMGPAKIVDLDSPTSPLPQALAQPNDGGRTRIGNTPSCSLCGGNHGDEHDCQNHDFANDGICSESCEACKDTQPKDGGKGEKLFQALKTAQYAYWDAKLAMEKHLAPMPELKGFDTDLGYDDDESIIDTGSNLADLVEHIKANHDEFEEEADDAAV